MAADPKPHATLGVTIQSGQARYSFSMLTYVPLTAAGRSALESALGAPLQERKYRAEDLDSDDDDADDDGGQGTPPASQPASPHASPQPARRPASAKSAGTVEPPGPVFLTSTWTRPVALNGLQVEYEIDAAALLRAVMSAGSDTLAIYISHPKLGYSGCTDPRPDRDSIYTRYSSTEIHSFTLTGSGGAAQPAVIHISYGYTNRMLAARGIAAGIFFLIPVFLALWKRISASRSDARDALASRFAAFRLLNLISIGVPVLWLVFRGLTGVRELERLLTPSYERGSRALIETAIYILPPALVIAICYLILGPLLKRSDGKGSVKQSTLREAGRLLLSVGLRFLLLFACLAELIQGRFTYAIAYMIASQVVRTMAGSSKSRYGAHALIVTPLRDRVFELAQRAGVRLGQVYVLPADENKMANAFATSANNVLLCEYLLRQMNKREVDGVVAHEIGHLRLHHAGIKLVASLGSFLLPVGISIALPVASSAMTMLTHSTAFFSAYLILRQKPELMYAGAILLSALLNLVLSRRFEYSADAFAVTLTRDPEAMITALVKLAHLNLLPIKRNRFDETLLTHPSTLRRVRAIASTYGVPQQRLQMLIDNPDTGSECYALTDTAVRPGSSPAQTQAAPWEQPARPGRAAQQPPVTRKKKAKPYILIPVPFALLSIILTFIVTMPSKPAAVFLKSNGIPIPLAVALAGILGLIAGSHWIKSKVLSVMPRKIAFLQASPDQFPGLDLDTLARFTSELKALGFDIAAECTLDDELKKLQPFARLFVNRSLRCFADVNQVMAGQISVTPVHCSISSYIDGGWSLSTGNAEVKGVMWANRLPKRIACSRPGFSPEQLLREHLSQRAYITSQLGAEVSADLSVTAYLKHVGRGALESRARVKKMSGLFYLLQIDLFNMRPKSDWLGRFAKHQPAMNGGYDLNLRRSESSTFAPRG
jgi:Zn-dependent protease with chaperone function